MGCNCGGGATASPSTEYIFTHPETGQQYTFRTLIEAKAYAARQGGGSVREVQKTA